MFLSEEMSGKFLKIYSARGLTKDLHAKAKLYVLRNFEEVVAKSDELLDISIDELYQIMNNDLLNIKDEALAWEGILRWIKYDADNRMKHVPLLLTTVRLGILQFQVSYGTFLLKIQTKILDHTFPVFYGKCQKSRLCEAQQRGSSNHLRGS